MNRDSSLFRSRNAAIVFAEMDRLHDIFKRTHKRALPSSLLSFSSQGDVKRPEYSITLYWENAEAADAKWVRENVSKDISTIHN